MMELYFDWGSDVDWGVSWVLSAECWACRRILIFREYFFWVEKKFGELSFGNIEKNAVEVCICFCGLVVDLDLFRERGEELVY
jgi:hypothetical protein